MKKNCVALFVLLFVLSVASSARAVLISVTGTLSFQVSTWAPFSAPLNGGNPFTINVDATTGAFSLPQSIYQANGLSGTIYSLPPSLWPIGPVTLTGYNAAGVFGPTWAPFNPGGGPGTCPTGANVNACVPAAGFGGLMGMVVGAHVYTGAPTVTMPTTGMVPLLNLPLSMFGDYNNNVYSSAGPMSGWGNGWTTGVARVINNTSNTFNNANVATITGHFWDGASIASPNSTLSLVTVGFIRQFGSGNIPITARLTIGTPEPGSALLLGAGLIGLVVARRKFA